MEKEAVLVRLLDSYRQYYTVNESSPMQPFAAEAAFDAHAEQYFLVRSAKISEMDSREYVFFALEDEPDARRISELGDAAWQEGLRRTKPGPGHRNTDTILILIVDRLGVQAREQIRRLRHYQSYRFGLWGWSAFRMIAYETSSGNKVANYRGRTLDRLFGNILL